jgi:hypothetical protein
MEPDAPQPVHASERLALVRQEIALAAEAEDRAPDSVKLVAVTKTVAAPTIEQAIVAGQRCFGENRVQEAHGKWPALKQRHADIELHLIGPLQTNKVREAVALFDVIETIRFMDFSGQVHERKASEVYVEYRGCPLFKTHIALAAVLKGESAPQDAIAQRMNAFSQKRWASQPAAPSAGCIFKNPPAIPAGKLIEELGLKGTRVGGAVVSDVHGNFIVNDGDATARDVLRLIDIIKQTAKAGRGIELETEVEVVGESVEDSAR